jgi:hypothetical protein
LLYAISLPTFAVTLIEKKSLSSLVFKKMHFMKLKRSNNKHFYSENANCSFLRNAGGIIRVHVMLQAES